MKKVLACAALGLLTVGCNSDGGSPTDPSQVNIEFITTDLVVGTGAEARAGNTATTRFTLWLYDQNGNESKGRFVQTGTLEPVVIGSGALIRGYEQALAGMRVGGKRRAYIPAGLAFGSSGTSDGSIPPNAALVFEIELLTLT